MTMGWGQALWFVAIIAMIPVALWLLKRTPLAAGGHARPGAPRAVAVLPVSAQMKLLTVEVGAGAERQWLVLGVGPQGIRTLHTMAAQGDAADTLPAAPNAAFAQLLQRLKGSDKDGTHDAR